MQPRENLPINCAYLPVLPLTYPEARKTNDLPLDRALTDLRIGAQCPVSSTSCASGKQCVLKSRWCDNVVDCGDASDEAGCSCRDRIRKDRVCDGYFDCPLEEDELGCFGCPKDSLHCNIDAALDPQPGVKDNSTNCFRAKERCDGRRQCTNGKDEKDCSILSLSAADSNEKEELFRVGYSSGFLYRNSFGRWYPVCGFAYDWAKEACSSEIGSISLPHLEMPPIPMGQAMEGPYLGASGAKVAHCFNRTTYAKCPQVASGTRLPLIDDPLVGSRHRNSSELASSGDPMLGIVGGRTSPLRSWPFVVYMTRNGKFICGGTVLTQSWVLTAAHCMVGYIYYYYEIEVGVPRRFSFPATLQIRRPICIKIHPQYNADLIKNDIALLQLNEPLNYNSWVRPILLPKSDVGQFKGQPAPETICTAVGWGATWEGGPDPDELQEVDVPIAKCTRKEDKISSKICAGYVEGGKDACQGDSGGPLFCRVSESNDTWYIAGIVSYGIGCARPKELGVYTKVSYYVKWINDTMHQSWNATALRKPRSKCPDFKCSDPYSRCLSDSSRCDRMVNCLKAEDEVGCSIEIRN
ncbi:serine protease nudel-like [Copidosoma floridanum]|uniref:serine protease nudel-like n=1 Tax=Copidosoma floridanum TaxID=29053 RepID=UPI0006C9D089|nr:serine protease nudel-like [Copidosoma floridanum]